MDKLKNRTVGFLREEHVESRWLSWTAEKIDAVKVAKTRVRNCVSVTGTVLAWLVLACTAAADPIRDPPYHALILGGGGPVGEAWESGVIAGLMEKGVDLAAMDRVIGTSAGAVVGARLAGRMSGSELTTAALTRFEGPSPQPTQPSPPPDLTFLVSKLEQLNQGKLSEQSVGVEVGEWALEVRPIVSEAGFVASFKRRFPQPSWPAGAYECVSVDAGDGSLRVWSESSQVSPALAVASSCALPGFFAPVTIDGRRYMDGGARSATNADLARGCKTAIVLAPTVGPGDALAKVSVKRFDQELEVLRASGCKVVPIVPDAGSLSAFGGMLGNSSRAGLALEAGRNQGLNSAANITGLVSH
jgi:NTE family protein